MQFLCTHRLLLRPATLDDADLLFALWTDPRVTTNVGYPNGLPITREEVQTKLRTNPSTLIGSLLVVVRRFDEVVLGECMMKPPDKRGIATTDVELLPEYWGRGYGREVKQALVDHLFAETACSAIEATPNVENIASIRMQEAVGGVRVGESVYEFPESMREHTRPVRYFIYRVYREHRDK